MMSHLYNSQLDAFVQYLEIQEQEQLQQQQQQSKRSRSPISPALPALGHAISGSTGSAISHLLLYPLDLLITRLQVQRLLGNDPSAATELDYDGIVDAVQKIYTDEGGLGAFYSGVWQSTTRSVVDSFLFFLAYNFLRQHRQRTRQSRSLPMAEELGVGMIAGAFSKFWTTPIQNIVTRKQTAAMMCTRAKKAKGEKAGAVGSSGTSTNASSPQQPTSKEIVAQILKEKGVMGLWSGYSASLVLTLNPGLTFLLHEAFLRGLVPRSLRSDPGARLTFLLAAASKAIASTITYPFSLAKTRAQVASPAGGGHRQTVFGTILRIARQEGLRALYEGVTSEVTKGFFSHGITMLMKERIHAVVIQLYYLLLKALQRYPQPQDIADMATERAKATVEQAKSVADAAAKDALAKVEDVAKETMRQAEASSMQARQKLPEITKEARTKIETAGATAKEKATSMLDTVTQQAHPAVDAAREPIRKGVEEMKKVVGFRNSDSEAEKKKD